MGTEFFFDNHTFVICAYKSQMYLDECIKSLLNQHISSKIIITTSTPTDYMKKVAYDYNVPLIINTETTGHIEDFCFAYNQVQTKYVTLCHQDDIYFENFSEEVVKLMENSKNPIICFSNYYELKDDIEVSSNKLLMVKRIMNYPLSSNILNSSQLCRKLILSFGCPICAPSVTYNKELVENPIERSGLKSNIDWDTWIKLSNMPGKFLYIKKPLLYHRIHELSTTTSVISNNVKAQEDFEILSRFWPRPIAKLIAKIYGTSEESNKLK